MSIAKRMFSWGVLAAILLLSSGCAYIQMGDDDDGLEADSVLLAGFDSLLEVNDFDGSLFGYWNGFPEDETQKCEFTFFEPGRTGKGCALRIFYNVDSPRVAYNGFWMLFKKLNFHDYGKISFWAKTDAKRTSPGSFKVELKSEQKKTVQKVFNEVDTEWKKFEIDIQGNSFMDDWKYITEFVIVFAKDDVDAKRGVLYIDDLYIEK